MISRPGTLFLVTLLAGCASLDVQDDQRAVEAYLTDRVNDPLAWQVDKAEADARIHELLATPLGPGEAVRIALLANPGWYEHPDGTVARKISADPGFGNPHRKSSSGRARSYESDSGHDDDHHDHSQNHNPAS